MLDIRDARGRAAGQSFIAAITRARRKADSDDKPARQGPRSDTITSAITQESLKKVVPTVRNATAIVDLTRNIATGQLIGLSGHLLVAVQVAQSTLLGGGLTVIIRIQAILARDLLTGRTVVLDTRNTAVRGLGMARGIAPSLIAGVPAHAPARDPGTVTDFRALTVDQKTVVVPKPIVVLMAVVVLKPIVVPIVNVGPIVIVAPEPGGLLPEVPAAGLPRFAVPAAMALVRTAGAAVPISGALREDRQAVARVLTTTGEAMIAIPLQERPFND